MVRGHRIAVPYTRARSTGRRVEFIRPLRGGARRRPQLERDLARDPDSQLTESATIRQTETLQIRFADWNLACRMEDELKRRGYRCVQTFCADLKPGQYCGKPLPAVPGMEGQAPLWLVAWLPRLEPESPEAQETPKTVPRFLAALERTTQAAQGFGLALAGICLTALAFRLARTLSVLGAPFTGFDIVVIFAGLAAANALLFAAAARIVPVLNRAWRWRQCRVGLWLLARSVSTEV